MNPLMLIPLPYRLAAYALAAAALIGFGWIKGAAHVQSGVDADNAAGNIRVALVAKKRAEVTTQVVTRYVDRVQIVRGAVEEITKEVPVYVTKQADSGCIINTGFVRVHDAAAQGIPISGTAGAADAAPSGVALSAVAATTTGNYGTCHLIREQVVGLQDWIRRQRSIEETPRDASRTP